MYFNFENYGFPFLSVNDEHISMVSWSKMPFKSFDSSPSLSDVGTHFRLRFCCGGATHDLTFEENEHDKGLACYEALREALHRNCSP